MNEERKMILEMVRDGAITVEEAENLMNAIPEEEANLTAGGIIAPKRIHINVSENGKNKVNIKVPFSLIRVGLKLGKTFGSISMKYSNPEEAAAYELLKNIDIDEILESLSDGEITLPYMLVDVYDEEEEQAVKIVLE